MICICADSPLCTFTLILYTCICIPVLQTAQLLLRIFTFLVNPHDQRSENAQFEDTPICDLDLPVSRFEDSRGNRGSEAEVEETCAICLTEFEKEDLVNKLPRCEHVFHMECMEKWLDRCQFTCPLCRSLLLQISSSPCKMGDLTSLPLIPSLLT